MPSERDYILREPTEIAPLALDEAIASEEEIHYRYVFQVARALLRRERGKVIEQEKSYMKHMSQEGFVEQFAEEIDTKLNELRRSIPQ